MLTVSYFKNAKNFVANNTTFNTYVSGTDVLQFLYEHAATGAIHDSDERYPPPICPPGTREAVILRIKGWFSLLSRPAKPIMWIHGPAGYGKTAIAGTISKWLAEEEKLGFNPLGATFYFWRSSPERNSPARFVITIAYQLALSIPELVPHIDTALKQNPMILRKALEVQLMKLIVEPFKALGELDDMPNRLVVVDALDQCTSTATRECSNAEEAQQKAQIRILDLIQTLQSHRLPLSFLILSRPEAWLKQHIESSKFEPTVQVLDLCQYQTSGPQCTITILLHFQLYRLKRTYKLCHLQTEINGPTPDRVEYTRNVFLCAYVLFTTMILTFYLVYVLILLVFYVLVWALVFPKSLSKFDTVKVVSFKVIKRFLNAGALGLKIVHANPTMG
ncbi:hypothetical protein MD484_g7961, partial [Candolleomyces efflorescens]